MQEGGKIYYNKITKWRGTKEYSKKEADALNLLKFESINDSVNTITTSVYFLIFFYLFKHKNKYLDY